jgi:hypothetical protein
MQATNGAFLKAAGKSGCIVHMVKAALRNLYYAVLIPESYKEW